MATIIDFSNSFAQVCRTLESATSFINASRTYRGRAPTSSAAATKGWIGISNRQGVNKLGTREVPLDRRAITNNSNPKTTAA